jgi:cellulose synthase/poly-beta-1,6-N-acetylglucosamine synthase-like glycosyltransferase
MTTVSRKGEFPTGGKNPLISVVIPARNEERNIWNTLMTLEQQEYKRFEIIVVNDASEDETVWVASHTNLENLRVVQNMGTGKKRALATGIGAARGSIIVTTDADCSAPQHWLKLIREEFRDVNAMMVFGGVRMDGDDSWFSILQQIEFSSLIGSGASAAALGTPILCNGANLAFRKKAFTVVKGYDDNIEIPSGDDEFLMRKIHRRWPHGIRFINDPASVVATKPQPDVRSFLHQRMRWASKWRDNSSWQARSLAVFILVVQIAFILNGLLIFTPQILPSLFLITIKMILEAAFLLQVCRFLGTSWNWLAFFALQVGYPFYVLGTGVASFVVPFRWKNRIFKPRNKPAGTWLRRPWVFI